MFKNCPFKEPRGCMKKTRTCLVFCFKSGREDRI